MTLFLLLPVVAAFLYALSSLFLKRGFVEGVGLTRTLFLSNMAMGLLIVVLIPFCVEPVQWNQIHLPIICALFFFLGQTFTFVAIRVGDVSVVTPTMGAKVIVVALIASVFFDTELSAVGWVAVIIAGLSVILLGISPGGAANRKRGFAAVGWATLSLIFFAFSDNLVSAWAPVFGRQGFVIAVFFFVAVFSFGLVPFFNEPLRRVPKKAWPWVTVGASILGLQALLLNVALTYEDPTVANTLYSSRGFWGVVLVVFIGSLFGNRERYVPRIILVSRVAGSVMILISVYLLFFVAGVG